MPGRNGTKGERGEIGQPGNDGQKGEQGLKGDTGVPGRNGTKGECEETGYSQTGSVGLKGDKKLHTMARGLCNIKLYKAVSSIAIDAKYTVVKWVFSHSLLHIHTDCLGDRRYRKPMWRNTTQLKWVYI